MSAEAARYIGAGIAALALYGVGMSMGNLFSNWINSVTRNPEAADKVKMTGFIGMAFTESLGLFVLLVALLILFNK